MLARINFKKIRCLLFTRAELSFFIKGFLVFAILMSFLTLFQYSSNQVKAQTTTSTASDAGRRAANNSFDAVFDKLNFVTAGYTLLSQSCPTNSPIATSVADPQYDGNPCYQEIGGGKAIGMIQMDMGAIGRLINSTAYTYDAKIAQPGTTVQYYASKLKGTTFAADSLTTGREVLAPMFFMSQAMKNLAYGVVVIILMLSALSTILSYLGKGEQKVTLVQLMINTAMTLFFITFFYEIGAFIYDMSVNYGNALVASTMEPFINAQVILKRLGPGGDLNATALINVFQFSGVSEGIVTVANNVFLGLKPAITQSFDAVAGNVANEFPGGKLIGQFLSFGAGIASYFASGVISSLLGSQAVFDAIIAWSFFFISIKIWGNLITAFISYNLYMGFGPLMMLSGIGGGYDKIKNSFKTLFAHGLVFPLTFLFILLGATMMNFSIKENLNVYQDESGNPRKDSYMCTYKTNDPVAAEANLASRDWGFNGFGDDPLAFRKENTDYQDIYDTTPAYNVNGVRACRSSLFAVPWTFLPAPLGNYGNRLLQIQTTDTLMRTVIAIVFLIMATRAPMILKETLQVDDMKSLQGMGQSIKAGIAPVLGIGGAGLGAATGFVTKATAGVINLKVPGMKRLTNTSGYKYLQNLQPGQNTASIADLYKGLKVTGPKIDQGRLAQYGEIETQAYRTIESDMRRKNGGPLTAAQQAQARAQSQALATQTISQGLLTMADGISVVAPLFGTLAGGMNMFLGELAKAGATVKDWAKLATADNF